MPDYIAVYQTYEITCCEDKSLMRVYGVVCYVEVRREHWKEKMKWHCIRQRWEWLA